MLLGTFIAVIVFLTIASILSLNAERKWLISENTALSSLKKSATVSSFDGAIDLTAIALVSPHTRIASYLCNAEASVIMGHLPEAQGFPYIPSTKNARLLYTLRNASITCMLIFGIAGTFLKLTSLIPTESFKQILNSGSNNSSEQLPEFLTGIESGLSIAFTPSIAGILAMILILSLRHLLIEGRRQNLVQDFNDFAVSTFAKTIHENQDSTRVASTTAESFLNAAKSINESSSLLRGSLQAIKELIDELTAATENLKDSTESLKLDLGENSALVGSIGALFDISSPLADNYKRMIAHLSKLEQSLAKHNGEVVRTFDGILDLAVAAKEYLPKVGENVSSTLKPISDTAAEWSAAATRWENTLAKAMPAESKRIEAIATALSDPSAPLLAVIRELKGVIERSDIQDDEQRHNAEILAVLQSIENRINSNGSKTEASSSTAYDKIGFDFSALLDEIKIIRQAIETKPEAISVRGQTNVTPAVTIQTEQNQGEHNEFRDLIQRIDKQQDSISRLVIAIQAAASSSSQAHTPSIPQTELRHTASTVTNAKPGLFGRIFGQH